MFELQGKLVFRDYFKMALYHQRKSLLIAMVLMMGLAYVLFSPFNPFVLQNWLWILIPGILQVLLIVVSIYFREKKNYTSLSKKFHEKEIRIDEEGIHYGSEGAAAHILWSDVSRVDFPKGLILIYLSANNVMLIPSRFFQSGKEYESCMAFVKRSYLQRLNLRRGER